MLALNKQMVSQIPCGGVEWFLAVVWFCSYLTYGKVSHAPYSSLKETLVRHPSLLKFITENKKISKNIIMIDHLFYISLHLGMQWLMLHETITLLTFL
jgi:hypothetical protein